MPAQVLYGTTPRFAGEWEALEASFTAAGFRVEAVRLKPRASSPLKTPWAARGGGGGLSAAGGGARSGGVLTDDVKLMRLTYSPSASGGTVGTAAS